MNFWINLWTIVFFGSLAGFTILAVVVSIGGFYDIIALFKGLTAQHKKAEEAEEAAKNKN